MDAAPELLYLNLLKLCLTRSIFPEEYEPVIPVRGTLRSRAFRPLQALLASRGMLLARRSRFDPNSRAEGRDWPPQAETMIGLKRLENIQACITDVLRSNVPGDLIETGVWRGGATIFMRAVLKAFGVGDRTVWVADSFEGLPKPDGSQVQADAGDLHWTQSRLAINLEEVKRNFARYGLLDGQVRFLKGWFKDTLPKAPIERLSLLRVDGDMYQSTIEALQSLYPKLSTGGYVIIDDFVLEGCRQAVDDFRAANGITEPIVTIDWAGVYWQRSS